MSYVFKHYTKGSTQGSGSYVFRNYSEALVPTTISFNIGFDEYQATANMTWNEWVNSAYNTDGYFTDNTDICKQMGNNTGIVEYNSVAVEINDLIVPNAYYDLLFIIIDF